MSLRKRLDPANVVYVTRLVQRLLEPGVELSDWERDYVDKIYSRIEKLGSENPLSDRELGKLDEIGLKHLGLYLLLNLISD